LIDFFNEQVRISIEYTCHSSLLYSFLYVLSLNLTLMQFISTPSS